MKLRTLLAASAAAGMLAGAGAAVANVAEVEITVAPPPERQVIVAEPRPGFVYERPHYAWNGTTYVWSDGRYIEERHGHKYVQPEVVHRGEHYYFRAGHWDDD